MNWTTNLTEAQIRAVQEVVDQLPPPFAPAFMNILDKIGGAVEAKAKFRYVWVDEWGKAFGTNDRAVAEFYADTETVLDVVKGEDMDLGDSIEEAVMPEESDDE